MVAAQPLDTLPESPTLPSLPSNALIHGDCLEVMRTLPAASIDAIITDPPYFRVKGEAWDRQWDNAAGFLAWMGLLRDEWQRILKPNGSLYVFASPQMAARVEVCLGERFNILNQIRWVKEAGWHQKTHKEDLRSYLSPWEEIIFCEQMGADSMALGESGYAAQCERLHGFVFEPLRAYLDGERKRAGINFEQVRQAVGCARGSGLPSHWFTHSQWALPTAKHYAALQRLFNEQGRKPAPPFADYHPAGSAFARFHTQRQASEYLRADYEALRADYEALRADYEALRRPFSVTADVPYTDVWDFATVPYRPGKHPCEKPLDLMRHIIRSSTRPDALVLDCFAGSGSTGEACLAEGRRYLLIERDDRYVQQAHDRLAHVSHAHSHAHSPRPAIAPLPARPPQRKRAPTLPKRQPAAQPLSLWG